MSVDQGPISDQIDWDDAHHTLVIGDRKGQFPGMMESRTFHVVFVGRAAEAASIQSRNPTRSSPIPVSCSR